MPRDPRQPFWPAKGDGPSSLEVLLVFIFAGIVAVALYFAWVRTQRGNAVPIVEGPENAAEHRSIAKPRE